MRRPKEARVALAAPILSILVLAAFLVLPILVSDYWVFFIFQMVAASYLALSFSFAYSYSKILSFAQGLFFGMGEIGRASCRERV